MQFHAANVKVFEVKDQQPLVRRVPHYMPQYRRSLLQEELHAEHI